MHACRSTLEDPTGLSRLDGTARVLSLLVLGTILLVVSFVFTRVRAHAHRAAKSAGMAH